MPEVPEIPIKRFGLLISPPSTITCIVPSFDEQYDGVVFTCTVVNEFGVPIEIESKIVQSPASVAEKL